MATQTVDAFLEHDNTYDSDWFSFYYNDNGPTGSNVYLGGSVGTAKNYEMAIMRLTPTGDFQEGVKLRAWGGDKNNADEFPSVAFLKADAGKMFGVTRTAGRFARKISKDMHVFAFDFPADGSLSAANYDAGEFNNKYIDNTAYILAVRDTLVNGKEMHMII